MPETEPPPGGVLDSFRRLCDSGLAQVQNRVELFAVEFQEEKTRLLKTLVIAAGGNDGVNVGEIFEIHQVVREVKDPTTKEVLDRITNKVGEMTITSVRDKIATGNYVGAPAKVGYLARKKMQ